MFVIVNKYILARHFDGAVFWPFVIIKRPELKADPIFMNHERIHLKQQLELLVVLFFIWYFTEYFIRLIKYGDSYLAYSRISFEREAYANERDLEYLKKRKVWSFLKYM